MIRRVIFVVLLLVQSMPLAVLAERHCVTCEHASEMKEGVHCPLRKHAARDPHCHRAHEEARDQLRPAGCTCGERAAGALRKGEPLVPVIGAERPLRITVESIEPAPHGRSSDGRTRPPDPPPRAAILL